MNAPAVEVELAYRTCEELTRRAAANFYYGIRLLPRSKRQAMSAVYAFARRVDDIGDGDLDTDAALAALAAERLALRALGDDRASHWSDVRLPDHGEPDPVILALADARRYYELPVEALELLIDGVELDVRGAAYETFDELVTYCRAVAGSIGRLCLAIFSDGHVEGGSGLADDLGVAMQLTNILRDIGEDQARGRVYIPAEDLRRFGCLGVDNVSTDLIRFEARRAQEWFDRGLRLVDRLEPRSASCVLAMTGIYRSILDRIARDPEQVLRRRISLRPWEKTWVAARSLLGGRPGARELVPAGTDGGAR
jgi:phytoene synthase